MNKTLDTTYVFVGLCGCRSQCRLRIYEASGQPTVVIATELTDNPGSSVTQGAEQLATLVWKMLERPEVGMLWIEHYPARAIANGRLHTKEEWDRAIFTQTHDSLCDPNWLPASRAAVEALIGQPLGETP